MSIFRDTFTKEVKEQLAVRQNAMVNRSPQEIQYINSRNSWIRMTSAVNVNDDEGKLAKDYVLLGGTLNNGNLRSGIGTGNQAYSTVSPGGTDNKRGIRLMPGITSIDVKSKSAYGSLREVVVNFQCWDISQLEELELLYMRPGYTVLVEWGWLPYLDNSSPTPQLITRPPDFYDILTKGETERTIIFKDLFNKSKTSSGNYDAMYGYIRNYSWSARSDGGYDCQTTIISTGEIIESLKVNYINARTDTTQGLLNKEVATGKISVNPSNYYSKNILAGLWYEAYSILSDIKKYTFPSNSVLAGGIRVTGSLGITPNTEGSDTVGDDNQCYLPLGNVIDIINKYVTKDILTLSLNKNTYDDDGTDLLCISHPLQVSVDPTVCLIASPLWQGGEIITAAEQAAQSAAVSPTETTAEESFNLIVKGYEGNLVNPTDEKKLIDGFGLINSKDVYDLVNEKIKNKGDYDNLQDVLRRELDGGDKGIAEAIQTSLKTNAGITLSFTPSKSGGLIQSTITLPTPGTVSIATKTIIEKSKQALDNLEFLKSLKRPYFKGDIYNEIGIIKNIYVNLNFLYKLSLNGNLESQDKKEKNEINVYNYVKNIISAIQSSLGNVNNFEIHVDPQDSIARIIDINYTGPKEKGTYESLFELEVHNLKSVVRSYTLQSQIFPEQGTIIAIGSQAKGGQLGIQNNTMIDFNRKLIDRIIPTKESASLADNNKNDENASSQLNNSLATLVKLFNGFNKVSPVDSSVKSEASVTFNDGKNALRDLIVYFQSITTSPGKNRNLIPTKFSFEMDGIGGLVIGHMFRLPKSIIPKGYRGESGIGSQLGQTITSIGHNISNNDWVTKIDALNIVLNDNTTLVVPFATLNLNSILKSSLNPASNAAPVNLEQKLSSFGKVDPAVPIEARPFLDMIAFAEGTAGTGQNGYDITVGFGRISGWNETYSGDHPKIPLFIPGIGNSNAAGRYQFLDSITNPTWKTYGKNYNYTFDKKGQDLAGYNLLTIKRKGKPFLKEAYDIAKQQITNGDINVNNNKAFLNLLDIMSYEWASLPDSNGRARYSNQGGKYTPISIYKVFIEAVKKY